VTYNVDDFIQYESLDTQRLKVLLTSKLCRRYCLKISENIKGGEALALSSLISDDYRPKGSDHSASNVKSVILAIEKAVSISSDEKKIEKAIGMLRRLHLGDVFYDNLFKFKDARFKAVKKIMDMTIEMRTIKHRVICENERLVYSIVKRFRGFNQSYLDLVQEGMLGLTCAFERFNHRLGTQFSTYAVWYIRQKIFFGLHRIQDVRVPAYVGTQNRNTMEEIKGLLKEGKTKEDIISELSKSKNKFIPVSNNSNRTVSLSTPVFEKDHDAITLLDALRSEDIGEGSPDLKGTLEKINNILKQLTPREEKLLRLRFGIVVFDASI